MPSRGPRAPWGAAAETEPDCQLAAGLQPERAATSSSARNSGGGGHGRFDYATDMPAWYQPRSEKDTTLVFESRFECGNLRRAVQASGRRVLAHQQGLLVPGSACAQALAAVFIASAAGGWLLPRMEAGRAHAAGLMSLDV